MRMRSLPQHDIVKGKLFCFHRRLTQELPSDLTVVQGRASSLEKWS